MRTMGKIVLWLLFSVALLAQEYNLEDDCLSCHQEQKIPSSFIYKRYLMKYSTQKDMKDAIFKYIKNPTKKSSIMPAQFFLKFPMKKAMLLKDERLKLDIKEYLELFDLKRKLFLKR